jgi:hypothetical protein
VPRFLTIIQVEFIHFDLKKGQLHPIWIVIQSSRIFREQKKQLFYYFNLNENFQINGTAFDYM